MLMHWLKSGTLTTPAVPPISRWRLDNNCIIMLIFQKAARDLPYFY
jgi:hypothetical protein